MIDYVKSFEFMSMLALFTYWIPAAICLSVYFFRFIQLYKDDLAKCEQKHYHPGLTLGLIIWCLLCSVVPAINLFALVFDCAGSVFKWLGKTFDTPLVRHRHTETNT